MVVRSCFNSFDYIYRRRVLFGDNIKVLLYGVEIVLGITDKVV